MPDVPVRPVRVLLVEDDPGDATLTLESLSASKVRNQVTVVESGDEALAHLHDEAADRLPYDLILLDLNLPGRSGTEVLEAIKDDPRTTSLPVVILTTSKEEQDIVKSYALKAAAFVNKPLGLAEFSEVVRAIEQFWFEIVLYPQGGD